ncbi:MAG: hypothetical protein WCD30_00625, partial [Pseudolabrys sp.]
RQNKGNADYSDHMTILHNNFSLEVPKPIVWQLALGATMSALGYKRTFKGLSAIRLLRSMLWRDFSGRVRAYSAARAGRDRAAHAGFVPRPGMRIADVFRSVSSPHDESCRSSVADL